MISQYRARTGLVVLSLLVTFFALAACETSTGPQATAGDTLRIGIVPHQNRDMMRKNFAALMTYIEASTGRKTDLIIPDDYRQLLNLFIEKKIDLALFGGVTFVLAHSKANAIPVVSRDVDIAFHSVVITNSHSDVASLSDLRGKSFSFGSELSTSGHLMPRYFFQQAGIDPESFFSAVTYSGAHDKTVLKVHNGEIFAGAVNQDILKDMITDGRIPARDIKVIWESPPFADYVWAMQEQIFEKYGAMVRDAFMDLSKDKAQDKLILESLNANYFVPGSLEDFQHLSDIMKQRKMID